MSFMFYSGNIQITVNYFVYMFK